MSEQPKRISAHERIMQLREVFDIPEEKTDPEDDAREERARAARRKRMDLAGTNENYVKMFNRDPWTDAWLGPGPEPPDPFMEDDQEPQGKSKKVSSDVKMWNAKSYAEWKKKYYPDVPVMHLPAEAPESKKVKKLRKKRKKLEQREVRQKQYDLAYWFLESWCEDWFRDQLYREYAGKLEELVTFCCEFVSAWADDLTYDEHDELSMDDVTARMIHRRQEESEIVSEVGSMKFKRRDVAERSKREYLADPYEDPFPDIPDEYWDEFSDWADKHPLKNYKKKAKSYGPGVVDAIGLRRIEFLKRINKRNKGFRKNLLKHDPFTGAAFVSKKKYEAHMKKQISKFDKQRREFVKMLDDLVAKGQISPEMSEKMMGDTKLVRKRVLQRHQEAYNRLKFNKKQVQKENRKREKEYEARKKWFKAHGTDINAPAFTVEIDGDEYSYEVKKGKHGPIYKAVGPHSTQFTESLDSFLAKPQLLSEKEPKPPSTFLGDDFNELPDY